MAHPEIGRRDRQEAQLVVGLVEDDQKVGGVRGDGDRPQRPRREGLVLDLEADHVEHGEAGGEAVGEVGRTRGHGHADGTGAARGAQGDRPRLLAGIRHDDVDGAGSAVGDEHELAARGGQEVQRMALGSRRGHPRRGQVTQARALLAAGSVSGEEEAPARRRDQADRLLGVEGDRAQQPGLGGVQDEDGSRAPKRPLAEVERWRRLTERDAVLEAAAEGFHPDEAGGERIGGEGEAGREATSLGIRDDALAGLLDLLAGQAIGPDQELDQELFVERLLFGVGHEGALSDRRG
ncbi:hypothetical protein D3C86_510160 [compost metagenome]